MSRAFAAALAPRRRGADEHEPEHARAGHDREREAPRASHERGHPAPRPEFQPYAEEYLALPDRFPENVLPWMDGYIRPALATLGDNVVLLAHYYMGGAIVKLVERYGGRIADSYELALQAVERPAVRHFVESAVHFMAEAIAILASPTQDVWITNPKWAARWR